MKLASLLRKIDLFYAVATNLPPISKNLHTILKNLEKLDTFADQIKYAESTLEHLSSGSSRIVYKSPDGTVIKLAKNKKGLAQNKAEANPKMKSEFLNKIISHAKDFSWIETNFLDKITEKEFEDLTGLPFKDFGDAVSQGLNSSSEKKSSKFDKVKKSKIYKEMKRLGDEFHLLPGDMERISSWGTKDKKPILIDAGLTREIYDEFYDDSNS